MLGSVMASLEEENEVLLARYCVRSFLPPLSTPSSNPHFRPRWLAEEKSNAGAGTCSAHAQSSYGPATEDPLLAVASPFPTKAGYEEEEQQSPLLSLPEELLWLVWELSRPTPEDLCRWSLVCRRFDRIACGHVGLWVPFFPTSDLSELALLTNAGFSSPRVSPKELYRAGRRLQYQRLQRRIDSWARAVAKATSFDDGEEITVEDTEGDEGQEKASEEDQVCPRVLFRDTYVYLQREPLPPLQSFKMFLWEMVIKSLEPRASHNLEMQLLSTPTPLPMISVRFYPLPRRSPVIKYVVVWNYFPFHEPKVTAVDSEVFGLPPLPGSVQAKRSKQMYLGSKPSSDHLKISIDAKMRIVQEVLDELFRFVSVPAQVSLRILGLKRLKPLSIARNTLMPLVSNRRALLLPPAY